MLDLFWVIIGLLLLYYGAEWLVSASSELAVRLGISPLVVGLTVVAFGTSAPELAVSIDANLKGVSGMALGNVVGSNVCNICLVLGAAAALYPVAIQKQIIRREMPVLLSATLVFVWFLNDGVVSRGEAGILSAGIILYVFTSLRLAQREPNAVSEDVPEEIIEAAKTGGRGRIIWKLSLVAIGIALLVSGAKLMVYGGAKIAASFGVSETVIGLTLFAFGTSLPELATSVVAALKKQGDIIVGNVVGSCIFNLLAVVGFTGLIAPLEKGTLSSIDLLVLMAVTFLTLPMMWHRFKLNRWEAGLLLVGYGLYVGSLFLGE